MSDLIDLDPDTLTFPEVVDVARHDAKVHLSEATMARVNKYREAVDALAQAEKPVYGVSTGFGALAQLDLHTDSPTYAEVVSVARHDAKVRLSEATLARVNKYREAVDALAQAEKPVYGVSTGFGALAHRHIPTELRTQLQKSLIRSHAAGVGEPVEREVVRALM